MQKTQTRCEWKVEFLNIKRGGTHNDHRALTFWRRIFFFKF